MNLMGRQNISQSNACHKSRCGCVSQLQVIDERVFVDIYCSSQRMREGELTAVG
jgi:hypothetical protein